jgi:hypothetical protein
MSVLLGLTATALACTGHFLPKDTKEHCDRGEDQKEHTNRNKDDYEEPDVNRTSAAGVEKLGGGSIANLELLITITISESYPGVYGESVVGGDASSRISVGSRFREELGTPLLGGWVHGELQVVDASSKDSQFSSAQEVVIGSNSRLLAISELNSIQKGDEVVAVIVAKCDYLDLVLVHDGVEQGVGLCLAADAISVALRTSHLTVVVGLHGLEEGDVDEAERGDPGRGQRRAQVFVSVNLPFLHACVSRIEHEQTRNDFGTILIEDGEDVVAIGARRGQTSREGGVKRGELVGAELREVVVAENGCPLHLALEMSNSDVPASFYPSPGLGAWRSGGVIGEDVSAEHDEVRGLQVDHGLNVGSRIWSK